MTTPAQQFADTVNALHPLPVSSDDNPDLWDFVAGDIKQEYFARSPFSSIESYEKGFVVHNFVTGSQYPCQTWKEASDTREGIVNRYKMISRG